MLNNKDLSTIVKHSYSWSIMDTEMEQNISQCSFCSTRLASMYYTFKSDNS